MSVLTKIFVVLLVVLSLLLSAATVTFVASSDASRATLDKQAAQIEALQAENSTLQRASQEAASTEQSEISTLRTEKENAVVAQRGAELQLATVQAQLAAALSGSQTKDEMSKVNSQLLAEAVERANALQTELERVRGEMTRLTAELGTTSTQLVDFQQRSAYAEDAARTAQEQLAELKTENDKLKGALRDRGVDPNQVAGGVGAGAPRLNGVVTGTRPVGGVQYAQISLGSQDSVRVGMTFNVFDRQSNAFLGTLTIRQVNPNDSIGTLEGPQVGQIREGNEVRTVASAG